MDPLTQGLLGASVGQAVYGRALGRRALAWGALVGMAPDLDVVASPLSPTAEWLWHRGPTHALAFGPALGPALGWLLWKRLGGSLTHWVGLCVLALVTHPLLDVFTTYGTQLFWPFSRRRLAFDAVGIVDPAYSLVLAAALVVSLRRGAGSPAARRAAWMALALSSAYIALGLSVNASAERAAGRQLAAEGVVASRVAAYPTLFQLPLRRVVARTGDEVRGEAVRVGWWSALAPGPISWDRFVAAGGPRVEAARTAPAVRVLQWFAMGETAARLAENGAVVEFDDLRYGLPGRPRDGLWGVRVRLDPQGRPVGPGERFDRRLAAPVSELLAELWRLTLGAS